MHNFLNLSRSRVEEVCSSQQVSTVHAKSLFRNLYKSQSVPPWDDVNLPRQLVRHLGEEYRVGAPKIVREVMSTYDGSVKFVLQLDDGAQIESVLMPETNRLTLCLSSQVGCRQGCVFCYTGRMGLKRHLTAAEIVGQVFAANQWLQDHPEWLTANRLATRLRVTNLVFMGMGEPLDNVDAVVEAISIVTDPLGMSIGPRRVSVSTAGHLTGLREITRRLPRVRIALSLHTADPAARSRLMPINRKWPIAEVVAFIKDYAQTANLDVLVQYTLISGVNDSVEDAQHVAELLAGAPVKVNLIPLNEIEPSRLQAPGREQIQTFRDVLHTAGLRTMIRYSKGQDIGAACGQLVQ